MANLHCDIISVHWYLIIKPCKHYESYDIEDTSLLFAQDSDFEDYQLFSLQDDLWEIDILEAELVLKKNEINVISNVLICCYIS